MLVHREPRYIDSVIVTQSMNSFALRRTRDVMLRSIAHESRSTYVGCVVRESTRLQRLYYWAVDILTQATRDILRMDMLNSDILRMDMLNSRKFKKRRFQSIPKTIERRGQTWKNFILLTTYKKNCKTKNAYNVNDKISVISVGERSTLIWRIIKTLLNQEISRGIFRVSYLLARWATPEMKW